MCESQCSKSESTQSLGADLSSSYASKAVAGAAQLYFTGDESYIRFLSLLAEEAMGLKLDSTGLWQRVDSQGRADIERKVRQATQSRRPPVPDEKSKQPPAASDSAARMEAQRIQMGLPEGLDLSLDLEDEPSPHIPAQETIQQPAPVPQNTGEQWQRIVVGHGTEADLLDVLGLVWIPPSLRFVREPKKKAPE